MRLINCLRSFSFNLKKKKKMLEQNLNERTCKNMRQIAAQPMNPVENWAFA